MDYGGLGFDDSSIRRGFIRKVYGILFSQLLITLGIVCAFVYAPKVSGYVENHSWLLIVALIVNIVLIIVLACCENVRRTSPANFIILFLFTITEGFLLGVVASGYSKESVILAVALTAAITFFLTMFSFTTKIDATSWGSGLFIVLFIFTIVGLLAGFFMRSHAWNLIYGGIGAAIFCLYIIYDTQLMIGGKHKYSLSPEEYVFASLNLYLDIVNLFLMLLQIFGSKD